MELSDQRISYIHISTDDTDCYLYIPRRDSQGHSHWLTLTGGQFDKHAEIVELVGLSFVRSCRERSMCISSIISQE
jgi:hypothetical protein